jgi:DNA-binding beta-propeller fold protein YncE
MHLSLPAVRVVLVLVVFCAPCSWAQRIVLVAGGGDGGDGTPALGAKLTAPFGVDFDRAGNMFIAEMTEGRVRKVNPKGILTTVAGTGVKGYAGDGGTGPQAQFNGLHNLAVTPKGDILLADTWNNRIREIDARSGRVSTIAGLEAKGFSGDGGPATNAQFGGIYCVSLDPSAENIYAADLDNKRIRKINRRTGIVRTIAGNGEKGAPEDGANAVAAPLIDPRAVVADARGNVYVLERSGNALRVIDPNGKIRTVVGTGQKGASGDGGDARSATLNGPKHLCLDLEGNILIADTENHLIRKYLPREGKIVRVAGNGRAGDKGLGGAPLEAELNQPHGVYVHPSGTLYISDSSNNRVLKIEP